MTEILILAVDIANLCSTSDFITAIKSCVTLDINSVTESVSEIRV